MLHDVEGWTPDMCCVPTALCAATGRSVGEVAAALADVTGPPEVTRFLPAYTINDRLRAARNLGFDCVSALDHSGQTYDNRVTIQTLVAQHQRLGTLLVFGENEDETSTHVFAAEKRRLVDTYTHGKIVELPEVPEDYNAFRVKRIFAVSKRSAC